MPDGGDAITIKIIDAVGRVPAAEWDACAAPPGAPMNPFVSHRFLDALERTGCTNAETGWLPQHLVVEDATGAVVAAAPLYLKSHSYGEYVFDHGWADAFERAGGRYYPKLQCAVPFTPVTGPRLLVRDGPRAEEYKAALVGGLIEVARRTGVSSVHVTFPTEDDARRLEAGGFLLRNGYQFHWENAGYKTFDDFLGALASRKRKAIRKERQQVTASGIAVAALTGDAIKGRHWDAFHRFYVSTYDRKWGYPYLTREFFEELGATMADRVVLVMAERNGKPVAGALNLMGSDTLYGRNWGCAVDVPFLHFECCYYQAVDFAIAHGLQRVEAGTQGPHKLQRGYLPRLTWSAHWIRDQGFRRAVADFVARERRGVERDMAGFAAHSPYRHEDGESAGD
jgi:predicted N-acyltransferase